jgi:tryptophan synthase beta chain
MNYEPDSKGHFGVYGGRYVAETLMPALIELEKAYNEAIVDPAFEAQYARLLTDYVGRPSPLYHAERLSAIYGGGAVYLKREDLNHTGAHKINNTIGQGLLAKRMRKTRLIAETGAGMHGVAAATAAAFLGMECVVYMGVEDIRRQAPNVTRMRLLGATLVPVSSGTGTLKDAMNEALRDWTASVDSTFYVIGSTAGPHPYPTMVRRFQSVIGTEARRQVLEQAGKLPELVIACVGGGSNAAGIFSGFLDDASVKLVGVEAAGLGIESGKHAASICAGAVGILHGNKTYLLQDADGQIMNAHSIAAGLDYPGVGPQHALWADSGRVEYCCVKDDEAIAAFHELTRIEGIIPALESSHALAEAKKRAGTMPRDAVIIVNLSGRGEKDIDHVLASTGQTEKHA